MAIGISLTLRAVADAFRALGDASLPDTVRVHVHTDTPEAVFTYAARWGREDTAKAQDMRGPGAWGIFYQIEDG